MTHRKMLEQEDRQANELIESLAAEALGLPLRLDLASLVVLRARLQRSSQPTSRPLIVHGGAHGFCHGLDLERILQVEARDDGAKESPGPDEVDGGDVAIAESYRDLLVELRTIARPTIAWVDGPAFGAGVGLAAACDVVVAGHRAVFGLPEALWGLCPMIVLPLLLERMSHQRARRLALEAAGIEAARAIEWGLADVAVSSENAGRTLRGFVRRLSRAEPMAIGELKRYSFELGELPERLRVATERAVEIFADGRLKAIGSVRHAALCGEGAPPWLQ